MPRLFFASLLLLLGLGATAEAGERIVRVNVLGRLVPQSVEVTSPAAFTSSTSPIPVRLSLRIERRGAGLAVTQAGATHGVSEITVRPGSAPLRLVVRGRDARTRVYDAPISVSSRGGHLLVVADVDIESLVASAVGAELDGVDDPAVLRAASVVFRSFIVAGHGRHASGGFDLCDTTHCLVSRGDAARAGAPERAAAATAGEILVANGVVVVGYCTGVCGGHTTTPSDVWGGPKAAGLTSVVCRECAGAPLFHWDRFVAERDVGRALADTTPDARAALGRPFISRAVGARDLVVRVARSEWRLNADRFRIAVGRRAGWNALPSSRFTVRRASGGFRFEGEGNGHGVGLCLAGAIALARKGADPSQILARYFPAATIAHIPGAARGPASPAVATAQSARVGSRVLCRPCF